MADNIPQDTYDYLYQHSEMWRQYCSHASTFSQAMNSLPVDQEPVLSEMLSDTLGYIHETNYRATIYQQALNYIDYEGYTEQDIDNWLFNMGYGIEHNQLRTALIRRIGQIAQNAITVIQGFVAKISTMLNMSIQEWQVSFAASPSITITFG
jgi:hypothetical protein